MGGGLSLPPDRPRRQRSRHLQAAAFANIAVTIPTSVAYGPANGPEKGTWRGASVTRPTATSRKNSNVELPVCACRRAAGKEGNYLRCCNKKRAMTLL